jgi:hypothetical protein
MARSFPEVVSGLAVSAFAIAIAALVSSQLMLMSVLDTERAGRAADQIATSRFVDDVVVQTVARAITPFAGPEIAGQLAVAASSDPRVEQTVRAALVDAHGQIVDPNAPAAPDGNARVNEAIVESVADAAVAAGVDLQALGLAGSELDGLDLDAVAEGAGLPSVVPDDVPALGLERVAETTRVVALLVAFVMGFVAVVAHPRPGRGLARIGAVIAVVSGAWLAGLLAGGWLIGLVAETLFGEMLDEVWREAVPSMLLLTLGAAVIGVGLWFGGMALDGFARSRRQRLGGR